jgi:glutaredoxin
MKCSRCFRSLEDQVLSPSFNPWTGAPVCDHCVRAQRHARQNPTFEEIRMAEMDISERGNLDA